MVSQPIAVPSTPATPVTGASAVANVASTSEQHVVLYDITWETYEQLLKNYEDKSAPRFTYDRGVLDIMSPNSEHEEWSRSLASIVETVCVAWAIDFRNVGSMTFRKRVIDRGFEPDSAFFIQREPAIRGKVAIDATLDPPPDLVIEIDVTHSSVDKFSIFAEMHVPEIWVHENGTVHIRLLQNGRYVEAGESSALPTLSSELLTDFLNRGRGASKRLWLETVMDWARTHRPT